MDLPYDPQKLLPAPDADSVLSDLYRNIFKPSDFRSDEIIDFDGPGTGRHIDFRNLYPDVQPSKHRFKRAVIDVTEVDFYHVEQRVIAAMAIPGVVALQLNINEGGGDVLRMPLSIYDLFAAPYGIPPLSPDEPKKQNGRSAAYLDRDPTKKHKRRR